MRHWATTIPSWEVIKSSTRILGDKKNIMKIYSDNQKYWLCYIHLEASRGTRAEIGPTYYQRRWGSGLCHLWGGLENASHTNIYSNRFECNASEKSVKRFKRTQRKTFYKAYNLTINIRVRVCRKNNNLWTSERTSWQQSGQHNVFQCL